MSLSLHVQSLLTSLASSDNTGCCVCTSVVLRYLHVVRQLDSHSDVEPAEALHRESEADNLPDGTLLVQSYSDAEWPVVFGHSQCAVGTSAQTVPRRALYDAVLIHQQHSRYCLPGVVVQHTRISTTLCHFCIHNRNINMTMSMIFTDILAAKSPDCRSKLCECKPSY